MVAAARVDGLRKDELLHLSSRRGKCRERSATRRRGSSGTCARSPRARPRSPSPTPIRTEPTISTNVASTPLRFNAWTPKTRGEEAQEHVMEHRRIAARDELDHDLDSEQQQRRQERDGEREEDDVAGRRAAHREELRVLAEDVEERLREREPRDGEQLSPANSRPAELRPRRRPSAATGRGAVLQRKSPSANPIPAQGAASPRRSSRSIEETRLQQPPNGHARAARLPGPRRNAQLFRTRRALRGCRSRGRLPLESCSARTMSKR